MGESVSGEEPLRAENESKSQGATTVSKENEERAPDEMEHQEEESAETREETSAPSFDEIFTEKQSPLMGIEQETESQEGQEADEPKDDSVNLLSREENKHEELDIDTKPDIDEQKSDHNSSTNTAQEGERRENDQDLEKRAEGSTKDDSQEQVTMDKESITLVFEKDESPEGGEEEKIQ